MKRIFLFLLMACLSVRSSAQSCELKSTVQIYHDVQELQRGLRVLYIAAHPDDENTRLISWLENDQHIQTAYLSLTRGQGGQNLIGDEKGDALGVIRTHELLEARKIDGGEQFFTRAIDFGYSKSAEESFAFWGKDAVLSDVVYVIRMFRPHVIVTRFPPDRNAGHGHHEASALLAAEAFDLAASATAYPEQLKTLATWQASVIYHNTSSWWRKELDDYSDEKLAESRMHRIDVGTYNDLLGLGSNEIASMARSMHRCQAFGTPRKRGEQWEYLEFVKGEWRADLFDSMLGVWSQSPEHAEAFQRLVDAYNFTDRKATLEAFRKEVLPLLAQRNMWAEANDMQRVLMAVNHLKRDLSGVRVEVYLDQDPVVLGQAYTAHVEVYNSSDEVREVNLKHETIDTMLQVPPGASITWNKKMPVVHKLSMPFWLSNAHNGWLYGIDYASGLGLADMPELVVPYSVKLDGQWLIGEVEVHRRWNDRSVGEMSEPALFVPPLTLTPNAHSLMVQNGKTITLQVVLQAFEDLEQIDVSVALPTGVKLAAAQWPQSMKSGQSRGVELQLTIENLGLQGDVKLSALADGVRCNQQQLSIAYPHIPHRVLHSPSTVTLVPLNLQMDPAKKILYVEGSGDEVDEMLEAIGYHVDRTSLNQLNTESLQAYDAVLTGIRAFNTNDELAANMSLLNEYVRAGGKLIVQYNTTYDLKVKQIGPYTFEIGRDRVTEEGALVRLQHPKHPIFQHPNAIVPSDWESWVQERGLYFASSWEKPLLPLIAWADQGEEDKLGALLVAPFGSGQFVYTGISFFRQLPAGVPGAYKLMVNLIEF